MATANPKPAILDRHRKAPDWKSMTTRQENEHWQEIQARYLRPLDDLPGIPQSHEDEVLGVVRLNTPPGLLQKMSG